MLVETFECQETMEEDVEESSEAIELIERLGLEGQQSLIAKRSGVADERCPYREITHEENFVYRTLCPEETTLQKYAAGPVPLRILQIAAHAESLGMFKRLLVWDRVSLDIKDPVLVASTSADDYTTGRKIFILARWGEQLDAFAILLQQAVDLKRKQMLEKADEMIQTIRTATPAMVIKGGPNAYCHCSY